jgi:hypothetical protein
MQEKGTGDGTIEKIFLSNKGSGYSSLPTISITTSTGSNGTVRAWGDEIGRIIALKTSELGKSYQTSPAPTLQFFNSCILTGSTGTFTTGSSCTSASGQGTIVSWDSARKILRIKDITGSFPVGETISADSGGSGNIAKNDVATATVEVVAVADTDGRFINEDGKLSETTMRVQDSKYYQDFSYVLKVARSIAVWRDSFKKTMHTAGFYFTGQVDIANRVDVRAALPMVGSVSGAVEIPLFQILNTLFSSIFGRRLGTVDDGTAQRTNALEGGTIYQPEDQIEHFAANQRDVTLTRPGLEIDYVSRKRTRVDGVQFRQGYAYAGPRWGTINKYANTIFGVNNAGSGHTLKTLGDLKVFGTRSALDGRAGIFLMSSDPNGQNVKVNLAFPSQLAFSSNSFDNTVVNFAQTGPTFDDTTP